MNNYITQRKFTRYCCIFIIYSLLLLLLHGCASSPDSENPASASTDSAVPATTDDASAASTDSGSPSSEPASDEAETANADANTSSAPKVAAEEAKPPRVVESCKDEAYIKYEKQARESMKKGLAATKADQFGVGFRSVEEHNLWSKVHGELFKKVSAACEVLSECAKKHKKDKDTECVNEARVFSDWQNLAKSFATKAKMAETTQPPKICSLEPKLSDPARCFHGLADNIKAACDTEDCTDLSQCWNSVGYLDKAIIQAEQACGFVHQKLQGCRGYTEATSRRENKFKQCLDMQGRINLTVYPVL